MLRRALELFKSLPETDVEELARLSELLAEKFALEYQEWLYWFEPKARR